MFGIQNIYLPVNFRTIQHSEKHIALHLGQDTPRCYLSNLPTYLHVSTFISSYSYLAVASLLEDISHVHLPESDSESEVHGNSIYLTALGRQTHVIRELEIFQVPFPTLLSPRAEWPLHFHAGSASGWKGP